MPSPNIIKLALAAPIGIKFVPGTKGVMLTVGVSEIKTVGVNDGDGVVVGVKVGVASSVAAASTCSPDLAMTNFLVS